MGSIRKRKAHSIERTITAPNGTKIWIIVDNGTRYVMLRDLAKALGYNAINMKQSLLGLVFKNHQFDYFTKCVQGGAPML